MEMNQYLSIFIDESKEHLQHLNETLLMLENENENISLVNEVFRSAHTLKGMAATMGYENMATLTHEMENLLDLVRNQKRKVTTDLMDTIFKSVDLLEKMLELIINDGNDHLDASDIILQLQEISSGKKSEQKQKISTKESSGQSDVCLFNDYEITVLLQSIESGYEIFQVEINLSKESVLKSARAYMVFRETEQHGEILKSIPTVEEIENEQFDSHFTMILISKVDQETIKNEIMNISEIEMVKITSIPKDKLLQSKDQTEEKEAPQTTKINNEPNNQNTNTAKIGGKTIRVDIERLDELMNLFSELIIDRGRFEQLADELRHGELQDTVEHMSRITSNLQNIILNLRMVPIEQVFNRFPRMVRDLAKDLNKQVRLNIIGAETELDRTVIDEIGDPLVHLLRNAVDHGLEEANERIMKHKPEVGEITLRAYHSGNNVFIEVSEDGKGINRQEVLNKAIEKNIISVEEGKNLTDQQVYHLLFSSGFSTAKKVSDISGRGVGLDVVKTKIESLGGTVSIESELDKGTKFLIQLPLTLSIISAMLVVIGSEKYAIPLSSIIETAIFKEKEIMYAHKQQVIDFRGRIVPLISLKGILAIPETKRVENDDVSVVIVRKGDKMAGLIVDSFIGQQEIVLKSLGTYLANVFAISGATILGDGQVALIIDTNALIK